MALFQGHQLGRVLVQNIWKVLGAFGLGVVTVVGGGLILSNVHTITHPAPSSSAVSGSSSYEKLDSRTGKIYGREGQPNENPHEGAGGVSLPGGEPQYGDTSGSQLAAQGNPLRRTRKRRSSGNTEGKPANQDTERTAEPPPTVGLALQPQASAQLAPVPPPVAALSLTLAANTPISVRLTQQLSSKGNHKGEAFKGTLAAPLKVQGIVVAEAGAPVTGRVVDARSPRFFRGGSNLNLELTQVKMADGRFAAVQTTQWFDTGAHSRVATAAILPGEAAKKAVSSMKSEDDTASPDSPQRTVAAEAPETSDKSEKKGTAVVLPPGSEIVFKLLQPLNVSGTQEHR